MAGTAITHKPLCAYMHAGWWILAAHQSTFRSLRVLKDLAAALLAMTLRPAACSAGPALGPPLRPADAASLAKGLSRETSSAPSGALVILTLAGCTQTC